MIATDTFASFAKRLAGTQGCPHVTVAVTPNPIRQLEHGALRERAVAMLPTVIEGLTLPASELERRSKASLAGSRLVRSSVAV
jgi:hypothetical protein